MIQLSTHFISYKPTSYGCCAAIDPFSAEVRLLGTRNLIEGVLALVADAELANAVAVLFLALHTDDAVGLGCAAARK